MPQANNNRESEDSPGAAHAARIVNAGPENRSERFGCVRWPFVIARTLLAVAMTAAGYLAWVSLSGGSVVGCGPSSPCDKVLQSRWAYWLGIPVSLPAVGVYVALLAATFGVKGDGTPNRQRWAWWGVMTLSATVVGGALWFVGLQAIVLKSFCKFCLTAHACGFLGAIFLLGQAPIRTSQGNSISLGARSATRCAIAGVSGVLVLVLGQMLVETRQYEISTTSNSGSTSNRTTLLQIHDGLFQLQLDQLPMIGSPNAPHVVVSLFDYACPHCRVMHGVWKETQQRFGNRLAIVNLPVPLSADCNDQLTITLPAYSDSCDVARLGLAVWRANRSAFAQFDTWIFTPPDPPTLTQVKQYAENLVGREALERALRDEWIDAQIQTNVAIYAHNSRLMKALKMPQAIVGRVVLVGAISKEEDMDRLLARGLGLKFEP